MDWPDLCHALALDIPAEAVDLLERLADELQRWNRHRNLTAIRQRDEILEKHLLDSLTLLPHLRGAQRLLDLGSGAGFPALPLKIVRPALEIVAIDAAGKKIDFQRHIVRQFALQGFTACQARIEDLATDSAFCGGFDVITARALTALKRLVPLARPFAAPGGRLLAMKGPDVAQEIAACETAHSELSTDLVVHRLTLPLSGAERCLVEVQF
ncbi:MAG: 16S rRNA (guanine(527)-N(7))-methyltransferase RsmG [Desulfuromonadales bacterium]|jgi:16S rRNA (guanine527-N7)-methyltransferase